MKLLVLLFGLFGCVFAQYGNYRGFPNQRPFQPKPQYQQQPQVQPAPYRAQYTQGSSGPPIGIRSQQADASPDGSYQWSYETENGISASEDGTPKATPEGQAVVVRGRYSYTSPDGTPITVEYYADENGFHAEGAHLPTPPPIPAAIQRALESLPPQGPEDDGNYQNQVQQPRYNNNRPAYNRRY